MALRANAWRLEAAQTRDEVVLAGEEDGRRDQLLGPTAEPPSEPTLRTGLDWLKSSIHLRIE